MPSGHDSDINTKHTIISNTPDTISKYFAKYFNNHVHSTKCMHLSRRVRSGFLPLLAWANRMLCTWVWPDLSQERSDLKFFYKFCIVRTFWILNFQSGDVWLLLEYEQPQGRPYKGQSFLFLAFSPGGWGVSAACLHRCWCCICAKTAGQLSFPQKSLCFKSWTRILPTLLLNTQKNSGVRYFVSWGEVKHWKRDKEEGAISSRRKLYSWGN